MDTRLLDPRPEGGELRTEGPTPSRFWGDQWLRVSEKVLKGLNHDLTNRVATLEGMLALLGAEGGGTAADPDLIRSAGGELRKVGRLLDLYRALPAEPLVVTEAVRLQDVVREAMDLHAHHTDLRGIPIVVDAASDPPPVLVRPSALLRSVLVLLESAAGSALRSGCRAELHLSYGGDEEKVFIAFEGPSPAGQLLFTGDGSLVHAVRMTLAHAHGTADVCLLPGTPCERMRYDVTLPTLAGSRRATRDEGL